MRVAVVLAIVLLAGCAAPAATVPPNTADAPSEKASTPVPPVVELAGANVTWNGSGTIAWDVVVAANTSRLALSWWSSSSTGGFEIASVVQMDGCPDDPRVGAFGGAVGGSWCSNPSAGPHHATWTMYAGVLTGRVCILAIPEGNNTLPYCDYSPY